jgi:hypothetical protein
MEDLRASIETDLGDTLESEFGVAVEFVDPAGAVYSETKDGDPLVGQVLYDTISQDADGNQIIDHLPNVTLRRSSLTRVPAPGEAWAVKIPTAPGATTKTTFVLERASLDGCSIGYIKMYLRAAVQS